LQDRVTHMKEMDISPEDLVQLKQDVQALSLSQELQKAHKIADYYHLLLHTMDTSTSHLTETGLYTPEQLQAFGSSINPVSTTTCQFLDQFHAAQHNIMSLKNDLFSQQPQRPVNIAMTSLFAEHLMSLPQVWKKIEEERKHQEQGGEPRPIVISAEDFQPDASSDELSGSKGSESDDKQEDKQ
ncbi:MAG: hypothetical protein K2X98_03125, partial [Alphaproteobacteria bacterium]|nr:hypothetical protein [Alphaproteobacteria bacterium]